MAFLSTKMVPKGCVHISLLTLSPLTKERLPPLLAPTQCAKHGACNVLAVLV